MSDFKLDIDYPYEIPAPEMLLERPTKVPYRNSNIKYLHYGELIQQMIEKAILLEDEEEKKQLTFLIANHMKKSLYVVNKDSAVDDRVFKDIVRLSKGKLQVDSRVRLPEIKESQQNRPMNVNNGPRPSNSNNKKRMPSKRTYDKK